MKSAERTYQPTAGRNSLILFVLGLLILIFFIINLLLGSVSIPVVEVARILLGSEAETQSWQAIVVHTRLPMSATAIMAGAALGVSGLMMQTLFRNPLAGPSLLGVSAGASLGVAVMMLFITVPGGSLVAVSQVTGRFSVVAAAFAGSLLILIVIGCLAARFRSITIILILGIMIAYTTSSLVGILQFYSMKEDLQAFVIWGLGSFGNVPLKQISVFIVLILGGLVLSAALIKPLNLLLLGENYAVNLGLNTRASRFWIISATGLLTATVTAYCGPIAFLGLAVPHLARNLFRTSDHRVILPGTLLCGALLALVCNIIARLPGFDSALPINAITSLIGAPVVVWLIMKRNDFKSIT